jgi:hypothetical protein
MKLRADYTKRKKLYAKRLPSPWRLYFGSLGDVAAFAAFVTTFPAQIAPVCAGKRELTRLAAYFLLLFPGICCLASCVTG